MQITLKNGETIKLHWNWLVIERLEDQIGDINNFNEKRIQKRGSSRLMGDAVYAVIQANYDRELPRNELLKLVNYEDIEKIGEFIAKNNKTDKNSVDRKKTHPAKKNGRKR